jgi:hypothetical protein
MSELRVVKIRPAAQHYEWGGTELLPALLGEANPEGRPWAELWYGAHPKAPAVAATPHGEVALNRLIASEPLHWLGARVAERFGAALPFLLKVLDARKMLSIQVHPSAEQAREGFERGKRPGHSRARSAPQLPGPGTRSRRSMRRWASSGCCTASGRWNRSRHGSSLFPKCRRSRPASACGCARPARDAAARRALLRELYTHIMHLPQERVDELLDALIERLERGPGAIERHAGILGLARGAGVSRCPAGAATAASFPSSC